MYNGYKHSFKKEHLPRARLNLAVSKDQAKLGRGRAGFPRNNNNGWGGCTSYDGQFEAIWQLAATSKCLHKNR